jgi:hypothetical protein
MIAAVIEILSVVNRLQRGNSHVVLDFVEIEGMAGYLNRMGFLIISLDR